jgi:hypothetical protein
MNNEQITSKKWPIIISISIMLILETVIASVMVYAFGTDPLQMEDNKQPNGQKWY